MVILLDDDREIIQRGWTLYTCKAFHLIGMSSPQLYRDELSRWRQNNGINDRKGEGRWKYGAAARK
jgi:hypothetical protein